MPLMTFGIYFDSGTEPSIKRKMYNFYDYDMMTVMSFEIDFDLGTEPSMIRNIVNYCNYCNIC